MNQFDFGDLADTISERHPLPWRAAANVVLDANGRPVLACSMSATHYDNATLAQFIAHAANLAVIGEQEGE